MNNKPVSIIVEESKKKIVDTINELHLSPTIMEYIIKDVYEEVKKAHIIEYENDMENYKEEVDENLH